MIDTTASDFTTVLSVAQTPHEVFTAVTNIRGWWSENIKGGTTQLHEEFSYEVTDLHTCKMKLVELIPDKKLVWLVLENHFSFTKDKDEWVGNRLVFEISKQDQQTVLRFTQVGLVPAYECYDICNKAWTGYIQNSLHDLIVKGKGNANPKGGGLPK